MARNWLPVGRSPCICFLWQTTLHWVLGFISAAISGCRMKLSAQTLRTCGLVFPLPNGGLFSVYTETSLPQAVRHVYIALWNRQAHERVNYTKIEFFTFTDHISLLLRVPLATLQANIKENYACACHKGIWGMEVLLHSLLTNCATNRRIAGSITNSATGIIH